MKLRKGVVQPQDYVSQIPHVPNAFELLSFFIESLTYFVNAMHNTLCAL